MSYCLVLPWNCDPRACWVWRVVCSLFKPLCYYSLYVFFFLSTFVPCLISNYSWPLNNTGLCRRKSVYNFSLTPKLDYSPSVSTRDRFQDLLPMPKSMDAQVPYIKWRRTMHTFSPPHPRATNRGLEILSLICGWLNLQTQNLRIWRADCIFIFLKFVYKWTSTVQTHVVQGSTVLTFCHVNEWTERWLPNYWLTGNIGAEFVIIVG